LPVHLQDGEPGGRANISLQDIAITWTDGRHMIVQLLGTYYEAWAFCKAFLRWEGTPRMYSGKVIYRFWQLLERL
jgi:hypothetical protein